MATFAGRFRDSAQPDALLHLVGIDVALGRKPEADAAFCGASGCLSICDGELAVRAVANGSWPTLGRLPYSGGFGTPPNLIDNGTTLEIAGRCGRPLRLDAIRQFVDVLHPSVLAFTSTLTSRMGRLDLIASGVAGCALLDLPLRHPGDALCFILHGWSDSGRFANAPGALPDIERTATAIDMVLELTANA